MSMFDDKVKDQLKQILSQMKEKVEIVFVTQEFECNACRDTRAFVEEVVSLSDKLSLRVLDFIKDQKAREELGVDKNPALVILDARGKNTGMKFYGLPGGYEINSFMQSLIEASGHKEALPDEVSKRIDSINKAIHIQVFISLGCPYCPQAVSTAHRLALENDRVQADMVESATFPHVANKYNVTGVPKIVINETKELVGAHPITAFLDVIEGL